jgi:hypothetical protein
MISQRDKNDFDINYEIGRKSKNDINWRSEKF